MCEQIQEWQGLWSGGQDGEVVRGIICSGVLRFQNIVLGNADTSLDFGLFLTLWSAGVGPTFRDGTFCNMGICVPQP